MYVSSTGWQNQVKRPLTVEPKVSQGTCWHEPEGRVRTEDFRTFISLLVVKTIPGVNAGLLAAKLGPGAWLQGPGIPELVPDHWLQGNGS